MKNGLRIGVIGFGALSQALTWHLEKSGVAVEVVGYLVRDPSLISKDRKFVSAIDDLLDRKPHAVIECAGQQALLQYGVRVLERGVNLVPASIGAFGDDQFREKLLEASCVTGASVRMPSGAIVGIDGLAAAHHVGIDDVLYRGTMPTSTLKAHYKGILPRSGLVFSGSAREAISLFPKNVNLTGTIALAGIGFDKTRVEMHVDPDLVVNVHELFAKGAFGEFHIKIGGVRISDVSPSSRIVAGSLAQAALGSNFTALRE